MKKLSQRNATGLAQCLSDRLVLARTNAELYGALVASLERSGASEGERKLGELRRCASQESEHVTWLEEQLRALEPAGRPTDASSPALTWTRSAHDLALGGKGDLDRAFEALFAVELIDHAAWHTLLQLADEVDDGAAKQAIRKRLLEKDDHLHVLRQCVYASARRAVLGGSLRAAA